MSPGCVYDGREASFDDCPSRPLRKNRASEPTLSIFA
jgi:hypothetical protein